MAITETTPKKVRTRRERIRQELVNLGYEPHEADAQADIAQMHLSDLRRGGASA